MIDAHAHLQAEVFSADLADVLGRAAEAGVTDVLVPGWDLDSSRAAIALCSEGSRGGPRLQAAVGVHPHATSGAESEAWEAIEELASGPLVVAIGETGLDYDRMFSPRPTQLANLRRHLDLALHTGKPLVLHCRSAIGKRDAQDDLIEELVAAGIGGSAWLEALGDRPPAVLHSYSGPVDYGERALSLGVAISFSGLVFRGGQEASAEVARLVASDRLLVETDAPFLPPRGAPRRRNEPGFVGLTAAWLAAARKSEVAPLERDLAETFRRMFART